MAGVDTRATPLLKATRTVEDDRPEFEPLALGDAVLADYRALGSAPDAAAQEANALVKFAPGLGAGDAQRIAAAGGVRLVGAPNAAGAWKAAVAPGRRAAVLDALRSDPKVLLAEPVDGATP